MRNNVLVTNEKWNVGSTHKGGEDFFTASLFKVHNVPERKIIPFGSIYANSEYNGMKFPNTDKGKADYDTFCLSRGYLKPFTRNTMKFVSSRAFRKHTGRETFKHDWMYEQRKKWALEERKIA